ncbi:LysR substrate-binding domain-containing protein [Massilia sp. erpn]|uniref:LysR substrate-binding domain-containing protein n=1 Tax=Massilia sp. erpn TaxID=2738142 RepID=UPI002104220C|nr:LysR substrate-binding domain-containing protein [Massilia sp. erpn]UTY58472.1 LysR family transcriptional regulator [Massilia sp. erpn]
MKRRLPSLSALRTFEAAARLQSFKMAAEELAVTATAVSHQVRALEEELGCPLFLRKTRAVELTAAGQLLLQAVREGLDVMAAGVERLKQRARSTVTLSVIPAFAAKWLVPRLAGFQQAHPQIDLHVQATGQPVDLLGGAADLAVRGGSGHYPGLDAAWLMSAGFAPVASTRLKLRRPADLLRQNLIHFDWQRGFRGALTWARWAQAAGMTQLDTGSGVRYTDESHAIQAAVAGQGVALISLALVRDEMAMGLLQAPFGPVLDNFAYYLVHPSGREPAPAVAAVAAWLQAQAQAATIGTTR